MKKTQYRRLFRQVLGFNPTRRLRRRITVEQLRSEIELEAAENAEPISFLGLVMRNGGVEIGPLRSFVIGARCGERIAAHRGDAGSGYHWNPL